MKIKFTGVPGEDIDAIDMYGYHFEKGKAVDVVDTRAQTKLSNHPHFSGGDAPLVQLVQPQTIPSVEPSILVSDGHAVVTEQERNAINADPRMLPGAQVSYEQILKAKEERDGDDIRSDAPSAAPNRRAGGKPNAKSR